jgi:hypothetical protein
MKSLDQRAKAIFQELIEPLKADGDSRKIDRGGACIMAVCVERLYQWPQGGVYSVSHYYEQNGDLMADPDMTFLVCPHGDVFPLTYQQDGLGLYQEAVALSNAGTIHLRTKLQADLTSFANQWMRNIKDQQGELGVVVNETGAEIAEGGAL